MAAKRLVDAIALISKARRMETTDNNGIPVDTFAVPVMAIEDAPTVDAVEVIRCKDCKYWKPGDSKGGNSIEDLQVIGGCKWTNFCRREMDFCSFGERKENG